jgi:hypothetical protein
MSFLLPAVQAIISYDLKYLGLRLEAQLTT